MGEFTRVEREGHLLIVTIDRPTVRNALHPAANRELSAIFDGYATDPNLWVAVITGAGDRAFCAGKDLKEREELDDEADLDTGFGGLAKRFDLDKPLIAAVNGVALGGGFTIALACDIVVASRNAEFAFSEVRVGIAASANGLHRLPRTVGTKHAMGMVLTGRRVSAEEGFRLGFVNEVAPEGRALIGARRWADEILRAAPMAVRGSKQAMNIGLELGGLKAATDGEYPAISEMWDSNDAKEGVRAFVEKRNPTWRGN